MSQEVNTLIRGASRILFCFEEHDKKFHLYIIKIQADVSKLVCIRCDVSSSFYIITLFALIIHTTFNIEEYLWFIFFELYKVLLSCAVSNFKKTPWELNLSPLISN